MKIDALFPFGIRGGCDSVGADALGVLTAGIHLDRRTARGIGWRGLRPCMGAGYAWTMRTVERQGVYGLAFLDEERDETCLRARCSVFYFPDPEEAVCAAYREPARAVTAAPDYFAGIREFTRQDSSHLFFLGLLRLNLRLDLKGLSFGMEVPARQRIAAVDGLPGEGVEKGGWACDVPTFRMAVPFIRLLALSAASLLECAPHWTVSRFACPVAAFTAGGEWGNMEGETLPGVMLAAGFGETVPPHPESPAPVTRSLAGRAFRRKEQAVEDFRPLLHVVSGFLGSGKTTFLSEWLAWLHNHDRHTAVLQNELGEKSLDSLLLAHETVSETLDEGCVCCTLADSLRPAVRRILDVLPTEQIILETTGLANPGAVADALDDLTDLVRPGLFISLVDMRDGETFLANGGAGPSGLAGDQIRRAGVLVCNKMDAAPPALSARVMEALQTMNPGAVIFPAVQGRIPFGELDRLFERSSGPGSRAAAAFRPRGLRHVTHEDEGYASLVLHVTKPMHAEELEALVRLARERTPRIKGIVDYEDAGRPMVVQYAAGALALETPLSPPGPARFLVLIGKNFTPAFTASLSRIPGLALSPLPMREKPAASGIVG